VATTQTFPSTNHPSPSISTLSLSLRPLTRFDHEVAFADAIHGHPWRWNERTPCSPARVTPVSHHATVQELEREAKGHIKQEARMQRMRSVHWVWPQIINMYVKYVISRSCLSNFCFGLSWKTLIHQTITHGTLSNLPLLEIWILAWYSRNLKVQESGNQGNRDHAR
jgi:hypothetical protein